jgi:endonuclease/exonuclease/phosphatase family metal-dependent hydrolase
MESPVEHGTLEIDRRRRRGRSRTPHVRLPRERALLEWASMKKLLLVVAAVAACTLPLACAERSSTLIEPNVRSSCEGVASPNRPLRVANYNIKSGMWTSLDDVANTLTKMDPDIVALEEVDNGMKRTGGVDQSAVLAEKLHAQRIFAAARAADGGTYGIALLSRLPIVNAERFNLPDVGNFEPRVAIDAVVCVGSRPLRVVSAHADVFPWAAKAHTEALAARVKGTENALVLGDFNAGPDVGDKPFAGEGFQDALTLFDPRPTFPGNKTRIDYILSDNKLESAKVLDSKASDHFPVMATLDPFVAAIGGALAAK